MTADGPGGAAESGGPGDDAPARSGRIRRVVGRVLVIALGVAVGVGVWVVAVGAGPDLSNPFASGPEADRAAYCDDLEERRAEIADAGEGGSAAALLDLLPVLTELADAAPRDVADSWRLFVQRIDGLAGALEDADVDPAAYDPADPPEGLAGKEEEAIVGAAQDLVDRETLRAVGDIEQHALDVCQIQLGL